MSKIKIICTKKQMWKMEDGMIAGDMCKELHWKCPQIPCSCNECLEKHIEWELIDERDKKV